MDQVALVGPGDLSALKLHRLATHLNNRAVGRTFYIHPDTTAAAAALAQLRAELGEEPLRQAVFLKEDTLLSPELCANKWIYQQLLKLSVDQLRDSHHLSEPFLFTDVDTLCLRDTPLDTFRERGKFVFYVSSDNHEPVLAANFSAAPLAHSSRPQAETDWFWAMSWTAHQLLGLGEAPRLGAIDACAIWSQKMLRKLKRDLETRFQTPWHQAIVGQFVAFILKFQRHFRRDNAFRRIAFALGQPQDDTAIPGFDELYHHLRLGFSEWQLYAYFLYTQETHPYHIGMLGPAKNPLVGEFNTAIAPQSLLADILARGESFPNFIYFYPNIDPASHAKIESHLLERLAARPTGR